MCKHTVFKHHCTTQVGQVQVALVAEGRVQPGVDRQIKCARRCIFGLNPKPARRQNLIIFIVASINRWYCSSVSKREAAPIISIMSTSPSPHRSRAAPISPKFPTRSLISKTQKGITPFVYAAFACKVGFCRVPSVPGLKSSIRVKLGVRFCASGYQDQSK